MFALFFLFMFLIAFGSLALTIWSVVDIVRKPFRRENDKVLWLILVLMVGVIGPIIYLIKRKELYAEKLDTREYLPDILDERALPQAQSRLDYDDDQLV
jgi:hypothetical protein